MSLLTLVNATDLATWANRRTAQETLPIVLRRLVLATTQSVTHCSFPGGDSVQLGGWDGIVVANEDHSFVPRGTSVWEMGTTSNIKAKADSDYEKRSSDQPMSPVGVIVPSNTTFVFVTPRRWKNKDEWAAAKRSEKKWADVRAYDADDLEAWLHSAPATHLWLSRALGKHPLGTDDVETVWADWSEVTRPSFSPQLTLAGREAGRTKISDWLLGLNSEPTLSVAAESVEEVVAIVAGTVALLPDDQRSLVCSRTIVVRTKEALIELTASDSALTMITDFQPGDLVARATRAGHRVLVPVTNGEPIKAVISLPRVSRDEAEKALVAMGISRDKARELAGVARRGLLSLRRILAMNAAVKEPAWSTPTVGPSLVPIMLVGQLSAKNDADLAAISRIAGCSRAEMEATLLRWSTESDPPIRQVGNVYYMISKEDAWSRLSRFLTPQVLKRFADVAVEVLSEVDPRTALPLDQQWLPLPEGKGLVHSQVLREGIPDSIAMLGSRGSERQLGPFETASDVATRIVSEILGKASTTDGLWETLSGSLPLLAEASPDALLDAVSTALLLDPSPIRALFRADNGDLFSPTHHSGLLWALETLAWKPDYLSRVAEILAALDEQDPGGKSMNRPRNSLRTILLPWLPQTNAGFDARLQTLDLIRMRFPSSAWRLMKELLPSMNDVSVPTAKPRWRDWAPDGESGGITIAELSKHASEVVARMLIDASKSGEHWPVVASLLDKMQGNDIQTTVDRLASEATTKLSEAVRNQVWQELRQLVGKHRSFSDATWALPAELVDKIASLLPLFEPVSASDRLAWLFDNNPIMPEGGKNDYANWSQALRERRIAAAKPLWDALGTEGIITLAKTISRPEELGHVLAIAKVVGSEDQEDAFLRQALDSEESSVQSLGHAFAVGCVETTSREAFTDRIIAKSGSWPVPVMARALLAVPDDQITFDVVAALGQAAEQTYWEHVGVLRLEDKDADHAIDRLLEYKRPHSAVQAIVMRAHRGGATRPEQIARVLEQTAQPGSLPDDRYADEYSISELLDMLEKACETDAFSEIRVAEIEFLYLPLSQSYSRPPRFLHTELARNPGMFVEAVGHVYRADGEAQRELTKGEEALSRRCWKLLDGWRDIPGLRDGSIDGGELESWVSKAREGLTESARLSTGDFVIGQLVSGSPSGSDGIVPAEPVREIVERLASVRLERGYENGIYNSRGVVMKSILTGGDPEHAIADKFESDAATISGKWPRTASMLRRLARTYRSDGNHGDVDAELRHDLD